MAKIKKTKRYVTLVEMMIVMFLIAMIIGVVAYNYTGSLDEGKAFKTKTAIEKIHTILDLHLASHPEDKQNISTQWQNIVDNSRLVKNAKDIKVDGWGNTFEVTNGDGDEILIISERYNTYKSKKGSMFSDK